MSFNEVAFIFCLQWLPIPRHVLNKVTFLIFKMLACHNLLLVVKVSD